MLAPSNEFLELTPQQAHDLRRKQQRLATQRENKLKRGRPLKYPELAHLTQPARDRAVKTAKQQRKLAYKLSHIAVLDFETDPFDNILQTPVYPFVCCIYRGPTTQPTVIWEENHEALADAVCDEIESWPEPYTIYAHNGGRFDYMFLFRRLSGAAIFKGRGIMDIKLGIHTLRDSFHLIPEKLGAIRKEQFDYDNMHKRKRNSHKKEIIEYLKSDCVYLYENVITFIKTYGFHMSIGQAAMRQLKNAGYKYGKLGDLTDAFIRPFYFGGRVECLRGLGHWHGDFKLYDVNSMYPSVMANSLHPISSTFTISNSDFDPTTADFIELTCRSNGAFLSRDTETGGLTSHASDNQRSTYCVTIHEYNVAMQYNLISEVDILRTITFHEHTNFSAFVCPIYSQRRTVIEQMAALKSSNLENSPQWFELKRQATFLKLILNNAYGKFATNPRRFKETLVTGLLEYPYTTPQQTKPSDLHYPFPSEQQLSDYWAGAVKHFFGIPLNRSPNCKHFAPEEEYDHTLIWTRDNPNINGLFYNVATGASITGAARAKLMEAIVLADYPLYCDTDSIICRNLPLELHNSKLGAWKLEAEISEVIIAGKKLYGYKIAASDKIKTKAKGASSLTWENLTSVAYGDTITNVNKAPTIEPDGRQYYVTREISATTEIIDWTYDNAIAVASRSTDMPRVAA